MTFEFSLPLYLFFFLRPLICSCAPHPWQQRKKRWQTLLFLPWEVFWDGPEPQITVTHRPNLPGELNRWPKVWCDKYEPKFETYRTVQHFWKRFQLQPRASEPWFVDTWLCHYCLLAADVPKSTHIWPPCLQYVSLSMWPLNLWPFDLSGQPFCVWQSFFTRACNGKDVLFEHQSDLSRAQSLTTSS